MLAGVKFLGSYPAWCEHGEAIRRDADADATIPVRLLAARHRTSRRTVLKALTPPSSEEGSPHPPWPAPLLAPLRELIDTWLTDEPGLPGYQIWERLLDEHDAEISYQRINAYLTRRRARLDGTTSPRTTPALRPRQHASVQRK